MEQSKLSGFIGTSIFHGMILLWLLFSYFSYTEISRFEGVLVAFGNIDEAGGFFESGPGSYPKGSPEATGSVIPIAPNPVPKPQPISISNPVPKPAPRANVPQERIITQETEQTAYIENSAKKEEEKRKQQEEARLQQERLRQQQQEEARLQQERQRQQAEADKLRKEQEAKAAQINNLATGAFGSSTGTGGQGSGTGQGSGAGSGGTGTGIGTGGQGTGTGSGTGSGPGIQGNPFGNSTHGSSTGVGGPGTTPVYSLQGRKLGADGLPKPTATIKEEGRIVVNITVDSKGNVIFTEIGSGTNIADQSMRNSAIAAAKMAKFNSIPTTENQRGTITYKYSLK